MKKFKELEQLTTELAELAALLKQETKPRSRMVILQRVQEIMSVIGQGLAA